eukprot:TRINITY_DN916_c0_g1_i5.p1 TRINITY_DN916_c0_g1~~TRINITY_DN916_c0_g1_i5.p1  ORF type:complete len:147 (-),score=40.58 TRINITY_DN916_c0_g1_i5:118-558(-)
MQGEYVSAEEVEATLLQSPLIASAYVDGKPDMLFPVAIVVPNATPLCAWARTNSQLKQIGDDVAALCKNAKVKQKMLAEVARVCSAAKLAHFKCVKDIYLHPTPFDTPSPTATLDLVTPTLKLKRHVVATHFAHQLQVLYTSPLVH